MLAKDYYVVLGVPRSESSAGIRQAFKALALRYHPDRGGPNATRFFQDLVEAYRVLSDPGQRAAYDRGLRHTEEPEPPPPIVPRYSPPPEPLVPAPLRVMHDFEVTTPSWEEVHDRFVRNFTAAWLPKSHHLQALDLVVTLAAEDAWGGGALVLGVPVFYPCGRCHGSGREWLYTCATCGGEGMVEEEEPVRVPLPPRVVDGTVLELPLRGLGIHNLFLRLLIRVA